MTITISHPSSVLNGPVKLPLSKSESNRALILQSLSKGLISYGELSGARDTQVLKAALASNVPEIDIQDAGTAMRFLTAYFCASGQHKVLTGSKRMHERPIGVLVDALKGTGFDIRYMDKEGFPPLEILPVDTTSLKNKVSLAGNISSQYISALMMIAPALPQGLEITFTTALASRPYLELTQAMMQQAGLQAAMSDERIVIGHQQFKEAELQIGADWSAASYWFSMAALSQGGDIFLPKLSPDSAQGDKQIAVWAKQFNILTTAEAGGISLHHTHSIDPVNSAPLFDFTHHPDLAQTMIVLCAAKGLKASFTGLQSLRIKETDRILALQNELGKFGVKLEEMKEGYFQLSGEFAFSHQRIATYNDHRMAMAFAPLAMVGEISIEDPEVVEKSYPGFWDEMRKAGFQIIRT